VTSNSAWRKSTYSGVQEGECVEVADLGGAVGVRDSKTPDAGYLTVSAESFAALVARVKRNEYDVA
jgi:hypothetical protein